METHDKDIDSGEETGEEQGVPNTQVAQTSSLKKCAKKDSGGTVEKSAGKKSPANAPAKSTEKSSSSILKKGAGNSKSKSKQEVASTKKQKVEKEREVGTSTPAKAKAASKSSAKALKKDQGIIFF